MDCNRSHRYRQWNSACKGYDSVLTAGVGSAALKHVVVQELSIGVATQTTYECTTIRRCTFLHSNLTYIEAIEDADEAVVVYITADTAGVCVGSVVDDSTVVSAVRVAYTVV